MDPAWIPGEVSLGETMILAHIAFMYACGMETKVCSCIRNAFNIAYQTL